MQVPPRLGVDRRYVAGRALRLTGEDGFAARGGGLVEAALRRRRSRYRELVDLERRKLRRDEIGVGPDMAEAGARRDRELRRVVEARVEEGALPVHLQVRDERVRVGDVAPAPRPRVRVHAREAEGGWDQRGAGRPAGRDRLAVEEQLGVELAGAPAGQHLA